jgi:peptidoglycan/LPS O-acetylase OafA/YrhL
MLLDLAISLRRAALVLLVPLLVGPVFRVLTNILSGGASHQIPFLAGISDLITNPKFHLSFLQPLLSDFSFFNYFDSLAWGASCAFLLARRCHSVYDHLLARPGATRAVAFALILVPYILRHLHLLKWLTGPFGNTLEACGLSILILQSVLSPESRFCRMLSWRWVCRLGVLSYSIYIWQQLLCARPEEFGLGQVWWMSFPGWLAVAIALGSISYYGFERPLLKLRARLRAVIA